MTETATVFERFQKRSEKEQAGAAQTETTGRWRMNRVGILNFWYYDEEEIELEDGRLILRGANGSGKSVTMQSFLPLVLDGDKRPHRLDPFGSRDRRIEYYLLGEPDSGKHDVTAYLWMEFFHPGKNLYKTIGIGLRARRGMAQVGFWGFLLEDGRRINRDFWLYDRNLWLETGTRVPLGRRELEEKIGSGGQVVQEQSAYRDLVNKSLFGFAEPEAFQELLQLMVQLRSPKLSKDFKPSAIYEILTQALPPLQEDELRPLSEVLEDMDQIADRLDEIRLHRADMAKLQEQYDRYNRYMLYAQSVQYLDKNGEYEQFAAVVRNTEQEKAGAEREKEEAMRTLTEIEHRLQETAAELDILENHEAIGKQRELEAATQRLTETEKYLSVTSERLNQQKSRLGKLQQSMAATEEKASVLAGEQEELLGQLESMSREIEFAEHDVYHRYWSSGVPEDDRWKEPWRRDLREHRNALETALRTAREERETARAVQEIERELGEARKVRDEAERERVERERQVEREKETLRDEVVQWSRALNCLAIDDAVVRQVFAALSEYGPDRKDYAVVRRPVLAAFEEQRRQLIETRMGILQEKKRLEEERERLRQEKQSWEQNREPEPHRTDSRARARAERAPKSGAPLYAVCDFRPHLGEEAKARLEEALERSGLLDAWISADDRVLRLQDDEEEVWIVPEPHEIGYTLADVLVPVPSEESGLRKETIDAVLRTFLWDEGEDMEADIVGDVPGAGALLAVSGRFRLGPLAGRGARKERAEFIGKETRRRTRLLQIVRLEEEIGALDREIKRCDDELERLALRETGLREESERFPEGARLQEALEDLIKSAYRLEALVHQESRIQQRLSEKTAVWRRLQMKLVELTGSWSRLKREKELQEALAVCGDYETALSDLHSAWQRCHETAAMLKRYREEAEEAAQTIEADEQLWEELEDTRRSLKVQVHKLQQLIEEMGLADIARQIEQLKKEREQRFKERKQIGEQLDKARERAAKLSERLALQSEQLARLQHELQHAADAWHEEMRRGLVREWSETYRPDLGPGEMQKLCKEIKHRYDGPFAGRNPESIANSLLEQFNTVRMSLTDYVLETVVEDRTGRIVVVSMRDRAHPQPPHVLLEELNRTEEEQSRLLSEKDRELYEEIILRSVGKAIRQRIHRAESWVRQMNRLMEQRNTSSGLRLKLEWLPKPAQNEQQLDTERLVELLKRDAHRLHEEEIDQIIAHFRSHIGYAKQEAQQERESLRKHLYEVLDYRNWFQFELKFAKGEQTAYRPLTDSRFNVLSGGEKAMAMYIPLFAATYSRYSDARSDAPRIISLDEAFAGVDEENMRDMFKLLTDMDFDYMMTSQVLWGCYDTVPKLAIYEIHRPKDADWITLFHYRWNGRYKEYVDPAASSANGGNG